MKTEGLYITLSPDGTIKRHLSTKSGEVPFDDTTIVDELIQLSEKNHVHLYQAIKEIWAYAGSIGARPFAEIDFIAILDSYLHRLQVENPIRFTLLTTEWADQPRQKSLAPVTLRDGAYTIANSLSQSMAADLIVYRVLDALSNGQPINLEEEHSMLHQSTATVTFTFGDTLTAEYLFRSEEQYYIFLLQHFLLSPPKVATCQYCGRFFIPKTRKKTHYCDRIVQNRKTCKQIAPYLKHRDRVAADKVASEFHRAKDLLLHRLDRTGDDKKASSIDLTDKEFCQWLDAAKDVRNRFISGEITEEEALQIIHVPTIRELQESK